MEEKPNCEGWVGGKKEFRKGKVEYILVERFKHNS